MFDKYSSVMWILWVIGQKQVSEQVEHSEKDLTVVLFII